ncbi:MAG: hypothetical protein JSR82_19260 [Verrucomicrobia bacterium]|nr:hypothetical protein [Verrucomicrobiota bacterium]
MPASAPAERTFNERVRTFWAWYAEVAARFHRTIEEGRCADLADEVGARVHELLPGFAWVFGPGPDGEGHSFTLSAEGFLPRQLLAQQWLALAPAIDGWTFHASRQAGPIAGQVIEFDGVRYDPAEIWITATPDEEAQKFDLVAWHPSWRGQEHRECFPILFLFLDEALGEYGTEQCLGAIEIGDDRLADAFPLAELPEQVEEAFRRAGWPRHVPGETHYLVELPGDGAFPRGDLRLLTTCALSLMREHHESEGELADPAPDLGADFVYLSLDRTVLTAGEEVAARGRIEDAIIQALSAERSGRHLGGGTGDGRCYIDLLLFDGARSLELVRAALRSFGLPAGTMLEHFAREKRGRRAAW